MQQTMERGIESVNITFTDWEGVRQVHLDEVTRSATVAELLDEARRVMDLPIDTSYQAVLEGRQLNRMDTLEEAGVDSDVEMEIVPEVHAG
jgi:hypothetical protein